jgi:hypothetical protein
MKSLIYSTTHLVLIGYSISILGFSPAANAALNEMNVDTKAVATPGCQDLCSRYINVDSINGVTSPKNLTGDGTWSPNDDLACDELKESTEAGTLGKRKEWQPTVLTTSTPNPSGMSEVSVIPDKVANDLKNCSVPLGQKTYELLQSEPDVRTDGNFDTSKACKKAADYKDHCKVKNSQVESHCMMFLRLTGSSNGKDSIAGGIKVNALFLAADLGVAATCGAACALPVNIPLAGACTAMGISAGVAEAVSAFKMKSDGVSTYISQAASIVGAAGAAATGALALTNNAENANKAKELDQLKKTQDVGDDAAKARNAERIAQLEKELDSGKKVTRGASCGTAVAFAALAGVRAYNIDDYKKKADKECDTIQGYLSKGTAAGTTGTAANGSNGLTTSSASAPGGSSGGSGGVGGGGSGNGFNVGASDLNNIASCKSGSNAPICATASGLTGQNAAAYGATDGGMLGNNLVPFASNIPNVGDLVKKAMEEGAGRALASVLPPQMGDFGAALAGIAHTAQQDGAKLTGAVPSAALIAESSSSYSGGGSGGSSGRGGSGSNNNALDPNNLFGGFGGGGTGMALGGTGTGLSSFGTQVESTDIWHADSKFSLFKIVSDRMLRVSGRVQDNLN